MNFTNETETTQYLSFRLDNEYYAVNVFNVREVLEVRKITRVPGMDNFMRGVINLRGSVVPVADLRVKFNLPESEENENTSIIVTEVKMDGAATVIGVLVDSVQEVIELLPEHIEAAPQLGSSIDMNYLSGMGKTNGDFIIILDINRVFNANEIELAAESVSDENYEEEIE